jgi:hypothetical protein
MTITADSALRGGLAGHGDDLLLTLDPRFQGLPDTAHGGSVLAAFHVAAGGASGRVVHGLYRKRVPLGTPLRLRLARRDDGVGCRLLDETDAVLVEGGVSADGAGTPPLVAPGDEAGDPLPVSSTCFACGVDNTLGLGARLRFDDAAVWCRWEPRATVAAGDGSLAPIALTTLLDEAAFWLGALATGESGMTTALAVTLHGDVPADGPVLVAGERAATRPRAGDARYWQTCVSATDAAGRPLATAAITFVAVRGAARRLVHGLAALNPPDVLRRVFPAYCA